MLLMSPFDPNDIEGSRLDASSSAKAQIKRREKRRRALAVALDKALQHHDKHEAIESLREAATRLGATEEEIDLLTEHLEAKF